MSAQGFARASVVAWSVAVALPVAASLQPSSSGGVWGTMYRLSPSPGMPAHLTQALTRGANNWNSSSCNVGFDDFPMFSTSGGSGTPVPVRWIQGTSGDHFDNSQVNTCAATSNGNTGGPQEVLMFSHAFVDGVDKECYPADRPEVAEDAVTHEIGHFLGSAHPNCSMTTGVPIMQGRMTTSAAAFYDTSRSLQTAECELADGMSGTPGEVLNECEQGDPDCDQEWSPSSPIIIDVNRNGIRLTGTDEAVLFDIDADGILESVSWTIGGPGTDPFLVLDRNDNGLVDDGSELFGTATPLSNGVAAWNGYVALAEFDLPISGGNYNGRIDQEDAVFRRLHLWYDYDHDGKASAQELTALSDGDLAAIGTNFVVTNRRDRHGNLFAFGGRAWTSSGLRLRTVDVFFVIAE